MAGNPLLIPLKLGLGYLLAALFRAFSVSFDYGCKADVPTMDKVCIHAYLLRKVKTHKAAHSLSICVRIESGSWGKEGYILCHLPKNVSSFDSHECLAIASVDMQILI